ncbi:MAG: hypothetical protein H6667_19325 [Ardenticatenaceae bacterium]|nr:hypothetical protein [Ardenticatenaceae bacterium]MCB9446132.1 hypothetical protein [Ardenticatenaceae bacterium]
MVVEKIFDDLFNAKHIVLSAMAFQGYRQSGKGAIPLVLDFCPASNDRYDVRMGVRTYQSAHYFYQMGFDESFFHLLETYNPTTTGIIVFSLQPMSRAGYFKFQLTPSTVHRSYLIN